MAVIVPVDPCRCRLWHLHERLEEDISLESCHDEIHSFREHGQLIPALGRPLRDDSKYDVELVCGARRLWVARHLGVTLNVELREMSDRDAILAMDMENRQRRDLSPYERGRSYAAWLGGNYFASQEEIAQALNISPSVVSKLLKLARLPSVVVGAFQNAAEIRESWGVRLAEILEDPEKRRSAIRAARAIAAKPTNLRSKEVYRRLLASAAVTAPGERKGKNLHHDRVVEGPHGHTLFRIRHQQDAIALLLPRDKVSEKILTKIETAVARIIMEGTFGVAQHPRGRELAEQENASM